MKHLNLFTSNDRDNIVKTRKDESKFGEHVKLLPNLNNIYDSLKDLDVQYVLFGIKDDVGVFANHGKPGTSQAWDTAIKFLLNVQSNLFTQAEKVLLLGHFDFSEYLEMAVSSSDSKKKQRQKARDLVEEIDKSISYLVGTIVKAGKTPIVIGGGHNNSYGNIKGSALALNKRINVVNLDAHSDFRPEEGRHSGNGFSYAYAEGFLKKYFILGLHQNYTSDKLFKTINKLKDIHYTTFEAIAIKQELSYSEALEKAKAHIGTKPFGIEVDCDAIKNIPSSAISPTGFSVLQARRFVSYFARQPKPVYLHLCEAAPKKKSHVVVGKLLSHLVIDFIEGMSLKRQVSTILK